MPHSRYEKRMQGSCILFPYLFDTGALCSPETPWPPGRRIAPTSGRRLMAPSPGKPGSTLHGSGA